jgi:ATP synthase F1 complex assembly factor 1
MCILSVPKCKASLESLEHLSGHHLHHQRPDLAISDLGDKFPCSIYSDNPHHPNHHSPHIMASTRIPAIRHRLLQPLTHPKSYQRRFARVHDVRFLATHHSHARIEAKYRDKLEAKAREQGMKDVEELKQVFKDKIEKLRKEAAVPGATAPLTPPPSPSTSTSSASSARPGTESSRTSPWPPPPPPPTPQPASSSAPPPPGVKTLNSFLDLEKVSTLPRKEVEVLWRLRHASNPQSLHFGLPSHTFALLLQTAKKHPSFVIPLPRQVPAEDPSSPEATSQAAELHYLQFAHPHAKTTTLLFTSLGEFKLRGEFASPHTTITFHSELADSHDLVLGQGTVMENRGVSIDEARWLVMCMQKFYVVGEEGKERGELLEMFTKGDGGFKVEKLLEEAEKIV